MADIFISYSRKDSRQALALAEQLRASGMEVWIDQHGIEAATSWSSEIVQAIGASGVLVVLLSKGSMESDNVVREISLAFEKKKRILPIELTHDYVIPNDTLLIENPLAVTTTTKHPVEAQAFVDFLYSPAGQQIFADTGYRPVAAGGRLRLTT